MSLSEGGEVEDDGENGNLMAEHVEASCWWVGQVPGVHRRRSSGYIYFAKLWPSAGEVYEGSRGVDGPWKVKVWSTRAIGGSLLSLAVDGTIVVYQVRKMSRVKTFVRAAAS